MQWVRAMNAALLLACSALFLTGCHHSDSSCPAATLQVEPQTIPSGRNDTLVSVTVSNPMPENGREVRTELYADSGTFLDPFAAQTTYTCAYDISGEVEICVDVKYGPPPGTPASASASEAIGADVQYVRAPTAYFTSHEDCSETRCTTVVCPADKNACPVISDLTVQPKVIPEGQTAAVVVAAEDPDANPAPLVTTLSATAGTFAARQARETTYMCDPEVGGTIEICVKAADGDDNCDVSRCVTVECPGPPPNNICPVIRELTATPTVIPLDDHQSLVQVDAFDPDAVNPEPLVTTLSASAGTFDDPHAPATTFNCGAPGQAEICVKASDGEKRCDQERCITVQCPSTIPENLCPKLYVLNAIPSNLIPEGQSSTEIQVRAQDGDAQPLPLVTTLSAIRGTFDNTHAANTVYHCERAGQIEVCADASDGACVKTLCMDVFCPAGL